MTLVDVLEMLPRERNRLQEASNLAILSRRGFPVEGDGGDLPSPYHLRIQISRPAWSDR